LSTNHIAGALAVADAIKDKSTLALLSIADNEMDDKGKPGEEAVGKGILMGRECHVAAREY
jgi:hypothetical protein